MKFIEEIYFEARKLGYKKKKICVLPTISFLSC